jgi:hypothetical protein
VYGFDTQVQKACSIVKNCLPRLCNYGIIVVKFEQLDARPTEWAGLKPSLQKIYVTEECYHTGD